MAIEVLCDDLALLTEGASNPKIRICGLLSERSNARHKDKSHLGGISIDRARGGD